MRQVAPYPLFMNVDNHNEKFEDEAEARKQSWYIISD